MLTKEIVKEMIEDNQGLSYIYTKNNGGCYICNDSNINKPLYKETMKYGVHTTNYHIIVSRVEYKQNYLIVEYKEIRRGYDNGENRYSFTVPYCNIEYAKKCMK